MRPPTRRGTYAYAAIIALFFVGLLTWLVGKPFGGDYPGHLDEVNDFDIGGANLYVASASRDKTVRISSLRTHYPPLHVLQTHTNAVWGVRFSSDATLLATASADRSAEVWQFTVPTFSASGGTLFSSAFAGSGSLVVSASNDGSAYLWDWKSGAHLYVLAPDLGYCYRATHAHNGKWVVTAHQKNVACLWDVANGSMYGKRQSPARTLVGHAADVFSACFTHDDTRVLTGSGDGTAILWDAASGGSLRVFRGHIGAVNSACFSPDDRQAITAGSDGSVRVWEAGTGRQLLALVPPGRRLTRGKATGFPLTVACSPDGRYIVSADTDHNAYVWEAKSGAFVGTLAGHNGEVRTACFSPDGAQIATASLDNTVCVWNVGDLKAGGTISPYYRIRGQQSYVYGASYSPDGAWLATACGDGTSRVYPASLRGWIKRAHELASYTLIERSVP